MTDHEEVKNEYHIPVIISTHYQPIYIDRTGELTFDRTKAIATPSKDLDSEFFLARVKAYVHAGIFPKPPLESLCDLKVSIHYEIPNEEDFPYSGYVNGFGRFAGTLKCIFQPLNREEKLAELEKRRDELWDEYQEELQRKMDALWEEIDDIEEEIKMVEDEED